MNDTLTTPLQIGRKIRQRRRELQLSQRDLALIAGVGERFIVDVEAGKPNSQLGRVLRVLQAAGLQLQLGPPTATIRPNTDLDKPGYDIDSEDSK